MLHCVSAVFLFLFRFQQVVCYYIGMSPYLSFCFLLILIKSDVILLSGA